MRQLAPASYAVFLDKVQKSAFTSKLIGVVVISMLAFFFSGCTTDYEAEKSGWNDITPYEARSAPAAGDASVAQAQEGNEGKPNTIAF
jgi:hypothetical protein